MTYPASVKIVEVGPRDGLQNEKTVVPLAARRELCVRLADAGLSSIEAGAFVSPKWVPQMAESAELFRQLPVRKNVTWSALVPNLQGLEDALAAGVKEVSVFTAASETFAQRNINCSIDESFARFAPLFPVARDAGVRVRGYVSTAIACPYEGDIDPSAVAAVAERLFALGCYEISLGDTIGVGTPLKTRKMVETVAARVPFAFLALHVHDTYGQALANILACLESGVSVFDASVAGLGGCPYAPGASGNVATEDVVYLLDGLGITTGIDVRRLAEAGWFICDALGRSPAGKVSAALRARCAIPD